MDKEEETAFMQVFPMVLGGLILFMVLIFIAARYIAPSAEDMGKNDDPRVQELIAERIAPVGQVRTEISSPAAKPVAQATVALSGEQGYSQFCSSCHGSGILGAPKPGDEAGWSPRLGKGLDGLLQSAIKGLGGMPARGASALSDAELRAAIQYMLPN